MQRNAFSSKDAFRDAPIEDDVLNFLESQRLLSDILTRDRQNYYEEDRKREAILSDFVKFPYIIASISFNFALYFA